MALDPAAAVDPWPPAVVEDNPLEVAVSTGDIGRVLENLAVCLGRHVVLQDVCAGVLAEASPGEGTPAPQRLALDRARSRALRDRLLRGRISPVLQDADAEAPALTVAPVLLVGDIVGFLIVCDHLGDELSYHRLEQAAAACALLLLAEQRAARAVATDRQEFFLDLVNGRALPAVAVQARRLGQNLSLPHTPIAFVVQGSPSDTESDLTRLLSLVTELLTNGWAAASIPIVGVHEDCVAVYLPTEDARAVSAFAGTVRQLALTRALQILAGWGPPCCGADQFAPGLRKARWVTEVLPSVGKPQAAFEELGLYQLLFDRSNCDEFEAFLGRWIGPLLEHDRTSNGQLILVLRTLLNARNTSAAAASLYVHISTLKYRLGKIESLLGVDLHDPEVQFNLSLALRLHDIQQRVGTGCSRVPRGES